MDSNRDTGGLRPPHEADVQTEGRQRAAERLRRMAVAAIVLVLVQSAIGMDVNLYVTIPAQHPGARAPEYLGGSARSVAWAVAHGSPALAVHAALGLALAVFVIAVVAYAVRLGHRQAAAWSVLAGLLVIGAGFNGASFLDFNHDISSLIMALLAFGAVACYSAALYLLPSRPVM
jgi:hypothetical protein